MPVQACKANGKSGYKWGASGKCYTYPAGDENARKRAKRKAFIQGSAIEHNRKANMQNPTLEEELEEFKNLIVNERDDDVDLDEEEELEDDDDWLEDEDEEEDDEWEEVEDEELDEEEEDNDWEEDEDEFDEEEDKNGGNP